MEGESLEKWLQSGVNLSALSMKAGVEEVNEQSGWGCRKITFNHLFADSPAGSSHIHDVNWATVTPRFGNDWLLHLSLVLSRENDQYYQIQSFKTI